MKNSFLSSFTPSLMSPETLEAIFVQRHKLARDLIELIRDSSLSKSKHFRLLVGMRGIGKTHTIALIYHRLKATKDLQDKLLIAWLKEEEWGVSSWLDLLMRIFQALAIEYPAEYQQTIQAKVESLYEMSSDDVMRQGELILKEFVGSRTLLLLVENLDEIFNGLKDIGQKQFRAYIQNHNFITIVATSQSLFAGIEQKESPFYGFFTTQYLDKLTIAEATSLLTKIAQLQNDSELESFIHSSTGKDRIKAIHHLAGGNHRVYIIFSQFLTRNSLDELVKPVMQTLDELTPYYQARMQWLSPQQRKIIELLCDRRNAVSVKEIAQRCFITHQTASSQLKDLRAKGYVIAESLGRASFYELQEPLMRICLEVKKQRGKPIKLFVDFLRIWYTDNELQKRLKILPEESLERQYINHALAFSEESSGSIFNQQNFDVDFDINNLRKISKEKIVISDGDLDSYTDTNQSIEIQTDDNYDWFANGVLLGNSGKYEEAILSFNKALKINLNNEKAWYNRGFALSNLGRYQEAILSYDEALKINLNNEKAWYNRGFALRNLKRYEEAFVSFKKALEINPDNNTAYNDCGITLVNLEKYEEAIVFFNRVLEVESYDYKAWCYQGISLYYLGKFEEAILSFKKALEIKPDDYNAWKNFGIALNSLGRYKEAVVSYDEALKIKPDDYDSWNNRGTALYYLEMYKEALDSYKQAISLNSKFLNSWFNYVEVLFKLNRWQEGFNILDQSLKRFSNSKDSYRGDIKEYIKIIWESTTDSNIWKSRLKNLVETYNKYQLVSILSKGIVGNSPNIMSEMIANKAAQSWLKTWQEIAGDKAELQIALRFLKTAVEYKENPGDRKILLQLPKEERSLLETLLK